MGAAALIFEFLALFTWEGHIWLCAASVRILATPEDILNASAHVPGSRMSGTAEIVDIFNNFALFGLFDHFWSYAISGTYFRPAASSHRVSLPYSIFISVFSPQAKTSVQFS
jgi:hypothetical protein